MKSSTMRVGVLLVLLASFISFTGIAQAAEEGIAQEGMSQGDFALWLVKAVGAQSKLPPAATAEDAIAFLTKLGIVPEEGWDKDSELSKETLASLLDDDGAGDLGFDGLLEKVREHVQNIFNETAALGFFPAQTSGSASSPA